MSVTVYSLGDIDSIRAAMTAVAMLFNPANTQMLAGTGPLGLGYAAGLGLLVTLIFSMFAGVLRQRPEPHVLFIVMIVSAVVFGPKTTITIEDVFTGRSAVVDDVPVGVAYSGGLLSGLMRSVTLKLDTALRSTDAEYSTLTEFGFVNPLKLILAVRGGLDLQPSISKSFNHYLIDCVQPDLTDDDIATITSPGSLLLYPSSDRVTLLFDVPVGRLASCSDASNWLSNKLEALPTTTEFQSQLQKIVGKNPTRSDGRWDPVEPEAALSSLSNAGFDAHQAMLQLASVDAMYNTFSCGKVGTSDYINCTASLRQGVEQYKVDSAGQASLFARTVIPNMNVLMFMFYAFSPLIALLSLMTGLHGVMQIMPKYLLFGVWSQSWMPVATVINFFIQKQTSDYFSSLDLSNGIRLADAIGLFDQVGLKVAAAANMLAATPVVSLALISGSVFALSQLARRGTDRYDEKYSAPDIRKTDAATAVEGQSWSQTPMGPMAAGAPQPLSLRMGETNGFRQVVSELEALGQSHRLLDSASERHAGTLSAGMSGRMSNVNAAFTELSKGRESSTAFKLGEQISHGLTTSLSDSDQKVLDLDFQKSLAAFTSAAAMEGAAAGLKGANLTGFVKNSAGKFLTNSLAKLGKAAPAPKIQEAYRTALDESINTAFNTNKDEVDSWSTRFSSGSRSVAESAYEKSYRQGWDSTSGTELASANEATQRREQSAQTAQERALAAGTDKLFTPQEIAAAAGPGLGFSIWGEAELSKAGVGRADIKREMQSLERRGVLAGSDSARTEQNRRNVAIAHLLAKNGQVGAVIQQLASRDFWKFEAPEPQQLQNHANQIHEQTGNVGLSPEAAENVERRAGAARTVGQQAQTKANSVPAQIQTSQQGSQQPITEQQFDSLRSQQHAEADASGMWNSHVQHALEEAFPPDVVKTMNQRRDQWKTEHGFKALGEKLGHDINNDPGAQALVAAVGLAAAAPVLEKAAAMGASGAKYVGRVLREVGKRSAPYIARTIARHGAATASMAVPVAGLAVGTAANIGLIGLTIYEGVELVKESMNAVDHDQTSRESTRSATGKTASPTLQSPGKS